MRSKSKSDVQIVEYHHRSPIPTEPSDTDVINKSTQNHSSSTHSNSTQEPDVIRDTPVAPLLLLLL